MDALSSIFLPHYEKRIESKPGFISQLLDYGSVSEAAGRRARAGVSRMKQWLTCEATLSFSAQRMKRWSHLLCHAKEIRRR
jgi:hypothetical protein